MAGFPIVGMGSSAGGLEALQKLFGAMPPDSGLAFVVAAHLDPTHESHLRALLGRCTKMPVAEIENSIKVEPDHVYVIAPDQGADDQGRRPPHEQADGAARAAAPGRLVLSLAHRGSGRASHRDRALGHGSNGSLGLRFIKAEGGIVIAQDPKTAGVEGMPRSAIATGIVDLVLPPEKIPEALLNLARHPYVRQPAETAVEQALQAYRVKHPQAVEVQGEPVQLAPSQGLELSLILHELETDAAKYGALSRHEGACGCHGGSTTTGRAAGCGCAGTRRAALRSSRRLKGFGMRLIERACSHELDGKVELDHAPSGLRCGVVFALH